ncbi:MAG TPA: SPASM domain-containing protein [Bacteriovoracaceae bacterium]|nr:SPASM domain-containing protein [Bacteriovoracaceae bacterium]
MFNPELKMVEIEINHHCNRACSYCPNSVASRKEQGEMRPELFEKIMQELAANHYQGSISYEFYNEPMLAKNFNWFVQTTRKYLPNNRIDLYTNGTLLTLKRFKQILNDGVSRFIVTKHEGIDHYVFDKTYEQLSDEEKSVVIFQSYKDLKLTNRGGVVQAGPDGVLPLTPCLIPEFLLVVTVLGNVLPCFEDFHEENIMGNIEKKSLKEIWENEKFKTFRQNLRKGLRHLESPCKNCNRLQVAYE